MKIEAVIFSLPLHVLCLFTQDVHTTLGAISNDMLPAHFIGVSALQPLNAELVECRTMCEATFPSTMHGEQYGEETNVAPLRQELNHHSLSPHTSTGLNCQL